MSFLDPITAGGPATELQTDTGVSVNVNQASPPAPGEVLTAVDATHATWQPAAGTDGANAAGLETTGAAVDVGSSAPPVAGQVLRATDPEHAVWRVPGLHYDPSIKFWTAANGSATIEPNTWGFILAPTDDSVAEVVVYIVSSLSAPPIDSRFGLYVGLTVTLPVRVEVVGASQIQGLDGVLATSTTLLPGANYEWIFYHEDGAALWGLVSDTAAVAKRIAVSGGTVSVKDSPAPTAGQALIATDAGHAVWSDIGGASTLVSLADAFANALSVEAVLVSNLTPLYGLVAVDGVGEDVETVVLVVGQLDATENGFWTTHDGTWIRALPLPADTAVGQVVIAGDGTEFAGSTWVYLGADEWGQLSAGSPIAGGDFMVRVGNKIHLVGPITDGVHGNRGGGALHAAATTTVSGFFTGAEKVKLAAIAAGAAAVTSTAPTQITVTTAAVGTGTAAARDDHVHSVATAVPTSAVTIGNAASAGTSTALARADHAHASIGFAGGGTSGFMTGNDQLKLANLSMSFKDPVRVHSNVNVSQQAAGGLATIDGVSLAVNDRVLLNGQSDPKLNGIWTVQSPGAWQRAVDSDNSGLTGELKCGALVFVTEGTGWVSTAWMLATADPVVLGTSNINFQQMIGIRGTTAAVAIAASNSGHPGFSNKWAPIDHVHAAAALDPSVNDLRLSGSASTSPSDYASASQLFLARYKGNRIGLYSGTEWFINTVPTGIDSLLNLTGLTAGIPADIFAVSAGLTTQPSLEAVNWTNASTRAVVLAQQDGVWVKNGAATRRYVGTILPSSATQFAHVQSASGASSPVCGIWNQDNRIRGEFTWTPTFDSWTIPSADTWQSLNAQASAKIQYVQGRMLDTVNAQHIGAVNVPASQSANIGVGLDSSSAPTGLRDMSGGLAAIVPVRATFKQLTPAGVHTLNAIATATSTSAVFYGAHGTMQGGLSADLWY